MGGKPEAVRNNYYFMICHIVFQMIVLAAYFAEVVKGARSVPYFLILAVIIAGTVISEYAVYHADNGSDKLRHIAGTGFGLMYMYVMFTAANPLIFVYAVPMLVLVTIFGDIKYCFILGSGMMVINVCDAVRRIAHGLSGQDMEEIEIQILSLAIYAVFTYVCSKITIINNQEKLDSIKREQEEVQKLLDTVMVISADMNTAIKEISDATESLKQSSEETMSAMKEVTGGTTETAESVQSQMTKTEEIQRNIDEVKSVSASIADSMVKASEEIGNGRVSIQQLREKVSASQTAGSRVVSQMNELSDHTAKMQDIIKIITNVASQTSLLSLNASIEAAHAGEAGKGFAVVADEISNLAGQTSAATGNITSLISDVSGRIDEAVSSINELMESNEEQNSCAEGTADNFNRITESAESVNKEAEDLKGVVASLADANAAIVDSIQTISAISEEVSAHANETLKSSKSNEDIVGNVSRLVGMLNNSAKKLEEAQKREE